MCGYTIRNVRDIGGHLTSKQYLVGNLWWAGRVNWFYSTQPLQSQGLFISSITNKAPKSTTDTWHLFTHLMPTLSSLHRIKYLNYFNQQQSPHSYSLSLLIHLFPQRNYQIHRSLSPSRMPFALLNLTAIWCHSSGIWFRRKSKAKGSCCCPGDIRLLLLLLLLLVSTNLLSILEPQWHLGAPLAWWRYLVQKFW